MSFPSNDLREVAAEAATLALAIRSTSSPEATASLIAKKAGRSLPSELTDVLENLAAIHESLGAVRGRKEELEALTYKITYMTACLIIKHHHHHHHFSTIAASSVIENNNKADLTPLTECVEAVEDFVHRTSRRNRVSMILKAGGGGGGSKKRKKSDIAELHGLIDELAKEMELEGIVAVFKGVLLVSRKKGAGEIDRVLSGKKKQNT